jgi:predicted GIY-YIG superfamily endonuclease
MPSYFWKYGNVLNNYSVSSNGGVYLLVFKGSPKRIIYVGTTNSFPRRMAQHKSGYLIGNRTIWKTTNSEDIYELMSYQGDSGKSSRFKYYASLAKNGKLWAHTTLEKETITNDLNPTDDFNLFWKDYVSEFYINNIEVWTCDMFDDQDRVLALESKIQRSISTNFAIKSHINGHGMSFLGKIEFTGDISEYKFDFANLPDLGEDETMIFNQLSNKKIIKFEKIESKRKRTIKQRKIKEARITHKFAYTSWEKEENEIIHACCKHNIEIKDIADSYLQRTEEEIKNRIKYLKRYYEFPEKHTQSNKPGEFHP